ncbi:hypothetical protein HPB50_000749 [Hyalomma asiaticum]|uniref:Uncharacterized protein n=1 Tax=Hyalomma asiaticum TaxID=266040 RepID=A0ACB7STS5_HYAAI|nr:hypothetical protein HPB50_000749 [Hyalomma asiaticum]
MEKYPSLLVEGDAYPPPPPRMQLAHALSMLKLALIALVLLGINPFAWMGTPTPAFFSWMVSNKLYSCLMLFFVCGAIESKLVSTGAFEIYFNDVRVWSKIETGRIPSPPELFQIIDNQVFLKSSTLDLANS